MNPAERNRIGVDELPSNTVSMAEIRKSAWNKTFRGRRAITTRATSAPTREYPTHPRFQTVPSDPCGEGHLRRYPEPESSTSERTKPPTDPPPITKPSSSSSWNMFSDYPLFAHDSSAAFDLSVIVLAPPCQGAPIRQRTAAVASRADLSRNKIHGPLHLTATRIFSVGSFSVPPASASSRTFAPTLSSTCSRPSTIL